MQGLEIIEMFEPQLELAPVTKTGDYMPPVERNHDPHLEVRGSLYFPLTERVASDLALHGEEWTRNYCSSRGLTGMQLDVIIAGAKRHLGAVTA